MAGALGLDTHPEGAAKGYPRQRVQAAGLHGVQDSVDEAQDGLIEEVRASDRFVVIADSSQPGGLHVIDLGPATRAAERLWVAGLSPLPVAPESDGFTLVSPPPEVPSLDTPPARNVLLRVKGPLPPELWNAFGRKIVPKLRSGENLQAHVELTAEAAPDGFAALELEFGNCSPISD